MLVPRTVFSLAKCGDTTPSRYAIGGIKLERVDGKSTAIATDGCKLVLAEFQELDEYPVIPGIDGKRLPQYEVILDAKACAEAAKLCASKGKRFVKPMQGYVEIDEVNTNSACPIGATDLESTAIMKPRTLDGRFPNWRACIPKYDETNSQSIIVNAKYMIDVLQAMIAAGSTDELGRVTITIQRDKYEIDEDSGEPTLVEPGNNHPIQLTAVNGSVRCMAAVFPLTCELQVSQRKAQEPISPLVPCWSIGESAIVPVVAAPTVEVEEEPPAPSPFDDADDGEAEVQLARQFIEQHKQDTPRERLARKLAAARNK